MSGRFTRSGESEIVNDDLVGFQGRLLEAVNRRETPEQLLAPGFSMRQTITAATADSYHGVNGWRDWINDIFEFFSSDAQCELVDVPMVGPDFVVATVRMTGHSALSSGNLEIWWTSVTRFQNGRATSAAAFSTPAEALATVGAAAG